MTKRVLISDPMSILATEIFNQRSIEVVQPGKISNQELLDMIADFDGLAIRSATKVTAQILKAAKKLQVVGRAGIGVDNVDVPACTAKGIVVMNAPLGNAVTTAEHALAMMLALARHIPQANQSTQEGKWAKSLYTGIELTDKLLGIIGSGNIGSIVARKALGFGLRVQAYDPFLTEKRATELGIAKVELEELLASSDIISLHVPKTPATENIIDASALNIMKKGSMLINCARGGLVDELALKAALESRHLRAAALDVFAEEPARQSPLFGLDNLICTPHLGASTSEAQEKVATQIAEQMSQYLNDGSISNSVNTGNFTADELCRLSPYIQLVKNLGSFVGQLTKDPIDKISITYGGDATNVRFEVLTDYALHSILSEQSDSVNIVNSRKFAEVRKIQVKEAKIDLEEVYHNRITITITTGKKTRSVCGAVIEHKPRLVEIKGIKLESEFGKHMLYITNVDQLGMIGVIGNFAADRKINIANMHLGRRGTQGDAISLLEIDTPVSNDDIEALRQIEYIADAHYLTFS